METPRHNALSHSSLRLEAEKILNKFEKSQKDMEPLSPNQIQRTLHELHVYQIELEMQNEALRRAEETLLSERKHYFELYNLAPVGYCTLTNQGIIIQANLTAATLLGLSPDTLIDRSITSFILPEDQDIYYLYHKKLIETWEYPSCELRMFTHDGMQFWAHLSASKHTVAESPVEMYLSISDISEYKRLEERLRLKEEMVFSQSRQAAIGEMMSMIAHQWRQPLNNLALINQDNYVKMKLGKLDMQSFDHAHALIDENLQFMSKTIDDFRNFFRPDQIKEATTIEKVLDSVLAMIGMSLKNNTIDIIRQSSSNTPLMIHKSSLIHVLLNILSNAKDAFETNQPHQATITISVDETPEKIRVNVCDNAGGIPESILDQLAQPYFTTKGVYGTGLGLYISRTIIEKYFLGKIEWNNNATNGACFVITLDMNHIRV